MTPTPNAEFWPEAHDFLREYDPEPVYASRTAEYRDTHTVEDEPELYDDLGFDEELDFH